MAFFVSFLRCILSIHQRLRSIGQNGCWLVLTGYTFFSLLLWPVPLLNLLHAESAAVVAFLGFFLSGLSSLQLLGNGFNLRRVLVCQETALMIPLVLLSVTLLWVPNCGYLLGLLFFALFPVISIIFAVSLAYFLHNTGFRWKRASFIAIGVVILVATVVFDLLYHPQFYVYNHIFGGILGPIYDEELSIRPGLFFFRGLTLLWALFFLSAGRYLKLWAEAKRDSNERTGISRNTIRVTAPGAIIALLIGSAYFFSAQLGLNTPAWYTQKVLGGVVHTEHFDIFYDPDSIVPSDLNFIVEDHEYQYARLAQFLELDVEDRIESYIYPSPEVKAKLTGARSTNVAPVWLRSPQLHILQNQYTGVFPHELVHVFSREFGLPVIHASLSIGLVEGLAVALEPPNGLPSPHEQVVVAALGVLPEGGFNTNLIAAVESTLSPWDFWTRRGAVSYTTMGSFVQYLLDAYGSNRLKAVYATSSFDKTYGKTIEKLAREWQEYLLSLPVISRSTEVFILRRFTIPSLFEQRCPHYLPPHVRMYRSALRTYEEGDSTQAIEYLNQSLEARPEYIPALALWARIMLSRGRAEFVRSRLDSTGVTENSGVLLSLVGDANVLSGDSNAAVTYYEKALDQLPLYAHEARSILILRTLLKENPDVLEILLSGRRAGEQAESLGELGELNGVVSIWRALRLAENREFEQADSILRTIASSNQDLHLPPDREAMLERQLLVWLSNFYHRSGHIQLAKETALKAAEQYLNLGDLNEAARLREFAMKMEWLSRG